MATFNMVNIYKPTTMSFPIIPLADNIQHKTAALIAMRRLYAGSLAYETTEAEIREIFEPFGRVTCLTLSWDSEKKHHKGFAFIEYDCAEAASLALVHLKGSTINGRRMKLGRPQAALRYQTVFAQLEMEGRSSAKVYISGFPSDATQTKISTTMGQFGVVRSIQMQSSTTAYVEFDNKGTAERALRGLSNTLTIGGQEVFVGHSITPFGLNIPVGSSFNNSNRSLKEKRTKQTDSPIAEKRRKIR